MQTSKPGKSVYLNIGVWYDEAEGNIHITGPKEVKGFHTWVSNDPSSKRRYHPNLFTKLAKCLAEGGAPHPSLGEADAKE